MKPAFTRANRYIFDRSAWSWSIPSGHTCPGAKACLAKASREDGTITNGPDQEFRCYSAELERFPSVRSRYWTNYDAVRGKTPSEVAEVLDCLPKKARRVRIHSAGDFFSQAYFDGWLMFIASRPHVQFYGFTKSVPLWTARLDRIPSNLILTASLGGKWDDLALPYGHDLKRAVVVYSQEEADLLQAPVDRDDFLAAHANPKWFALVENRSAMRERLVQLKVSKGVENER